MLDSEESEKQEKEHQKRFVGRHILLAEDNDLSWEIAEEILTEAGLLPGGLKRNDSQRFVCKTVPLEVVNSQTLFTSHYQDHERIALPIAHADGSYYADEKTLDELEANNQIVFRYATENPNGSLRNIAGITNKHGNVLGMMPHPERAVETILGSTDGLRLFESLLENGRIKVEA